VVTVSARHAPVTVRRKEKDWFWHLDLTPLP